MRFFLFYMLVYSSPIFGQYPAYQTYVRQADSLFRAGEFSASANAFSAAFETFNWRGYPEDRLTAAWAWARAGNADSAIYQLQRILDKTDFLDKDDLWTLDPAFESLQNDLGWKRLTTQWHLKQERLEHIRTNPISVELEQIHYLDQYFRQKRDSVIELHGLQSPEMKDWARRWNIQDSLNYLRVNEILETYGWLGTDEVTESASTAIWLVLQHADRNLPAQEKWLPVMREAVRKGKAKSGNLAYLEDRVLKNQGKPQRYGSQLYTDPSTGAMLLYPVEDPDNLDARRKAMELGPIQNYLDQTGAKWKR
ncbi:MAG: hypothetical protein H7246_19030 [Phycisphaerae bacterium]|nr:hypothetical protein [Saprospiraceae bacterium]